MNIDEFEDKLRNQPMRELPRGWRKEILRAAEARDVRLPWWHQWLWPCPQAWAGLAAVWLVILVVNALANSGPAAATPRIALSHQELMALKEQQLALAQLVELPGPADVPSPAVLSPRSERRKIMFNA